MKIHIVMHESFESPAAIQSWAMQKGHILSYSRVYQHEPLPISPHGFDFLVIMGGPQSPATTIVECPHFNAAAEIHLIKQAITANKLVLGVCLGAQLIGEAMGARFDHSPKKEIGVYPITLTPEAARDPIFSTFPQIFPVAHWHGDMPGLTKDAALLAYSEGCPRQVVRYTPRVYGFQCHFEFTKDAVDGMIRNCGNELIESRRVSPYIQTEMELRQNDYQGINEMLFKFLDQFEKSN